MSLTIPAEMYRKYHHFLHKYDRLEWSGPAWYSIKKDEHGFPTEIQMEYFHVLDLGQKTSTDWDGKDLMKVIRPLMKKYPKIGNEWIQGNIHSHNDMGAFFSGTDKQQLIDGANKNFYFSLVVSYAKDKELAFAVSYPDQFNQVIIQKITDITVEMYERTDDYKEEEAAIEKSRTKSNSITLPFAKRWAHNQQRSLFQTAELVDIDSILDDDDDEDVDAWNASFGITNDSEPEHSLAYDDLQVAYMQGQISKKTFSESCNMIGVDTNGNKLK